MGRMAVLPDISISRQSVGHTTERCTQDTATTIKLKTNYVLIDNATLCPRTKDSIPSR